MKRLLLGLLLVSCLGSFGCSEESAAFPPAGGSGPGGHGGSAGQAGLGGSAGQGGTAGQGGLGATAGQGGLGGMAGQGGLGATAGQGGLGATAGQGGLGGMAGQGGLGGSAGQGGLGGAGGQGGGGGGPLDAVLVTTGDPDKVLLRGLVVSMAEPPYAGEVLIEGGYLSCVAPDCSAEPGALTASVVETNGIIMPGMIDTHNHILYDIFNADDWTPSQLYTNHNQWTNEASYGALVDAKQYLNGQNGSPVNVNCELLKYGEVKALIAGTTALVGAADPANKVCYRTVVRTIDQTANELCGNDPSTGCPDHVQVNTLFPSTAAADQVCDNFVAGTTDAYLIHLGEGVDQVALDEWTALYDVTTDPGCLMDPRTGIVHGTAFGDTEFFEMWWVDMGLTWSPSSNVFLYGGGTDLTKTTNIPLALYNGLRVSISPDWSIGGSENLLAEMRFADLVDGAVWGDVLSPEMLVEMVTVNPAAMLGLSAELGSLEVGKLADVVVLGGDALQPYESIVAARPHEIRLVTVHGVPLYGDDQLVALGPVDPGCEATTICGRAKFMCIAVPPIANPDAQKFGQSFAQIESVLSTELAAYDALDLSIWDFSPLAPIATCP